MKHLLFFLFIPCLIWAQNISINPRDISNANIELKRAVIENRSIKGSPYLDENFTKTRLEFKDGKLFEADMRFDATHNVFELKSSKDGLIYELKLKDGMKAYHLEKTFATHYLSSENKVATFEILVNPNPYGLYLYHFKNIEESHRESIGLPSSNQGNNQDVSWVDNSFMILIKNNEVYQLTKSHKKVIESGLVNSNEYKKIINKHKYKLSKTEDVIELVNKLNSIQ